MRVGDDRGRPPNIRFGYYLLLVVYAFMAVFTVVVLRRLVRAPLPVELGGPGEAET
jgi:hypothetical protein